LQLHISVLDPAEAFHNDVEEKAEDSWSYEVKSYDFSEQFTYVIE